MLKYLRFASDITCVHVRGRSSRKYVHTKFKPHVSLCSLYSIYECKPGIQPLHPQYSTISPSCTAEASRYYSIYLVNGPAGAVVCTVLAVVCTVPAVVSAGRHTGVGIDIIGVGEEGGSFRHLRLICVHTQIIDPAISPAST